MSEENEVGKGNPPKHTRFKKGQSGNPKGRPKGTKNFKTDVQSTLAEPVKVTKDGAPKNVSSQKAALLRLREKALNGDARALDKYLALAKEFNAEELPGDTAEALAAGDEAIIEGLEVRIRNELRAEEVAAGEKPPENEDDEDGLEDWLK